MSSPSRLVISVRVLLVGALLGATPAYANPPDKTQCADAHARTQQRRAAGKLIEARQQALACADKGCPGVVQTECAGFLAEIDKATPTVVIVVRGAPPSSAQVAVDGVAVAVDGRALPLDPGPHEVVARAGERQVQKALVAAEGAKNVKVELIFEAPEDTPAAPGGGTSPLVPIGFAVGGAGLVAFAVAGGLALSTRSELRDACGGNVCPPDRQDDIDAGTAAAHAATVGLIACGVGVALGVVGLLLPARDGDRVSLDRHGLRLTF